MKLRDNKGSITVFVLVGLLFMSAFLLLSYGSNVNKSKTAKEMFQMVSNIYSYNDGDENAYMRAYTALRKQNAQEMTSSSENNNTLELTKTFYGPISNYTIYGNSVQSILPAEYQQVEYIQNEGNQYIDTKVLASQSNSFEVKAQLDNTDVSSQTIWGGRNSANNGSMQGNQLSCVQSTGNYQFVSGDTSIATEAWDTELHTFYANKNKFYVDGTLIYTANSRSITTENNVYLFATNTAGTVGFNGGSLKIYYCKIWNNDTLIRYFIPCYRKSDNVIGMYDLVNNVFYTNAGTGTFLKGVDAPTPEAPIEIQSVGDLVTDTADENYGKYKIPVKVSGKNLFNKYEDYIYTTSSIGTEYTETGVILKNNQSGGNWCANVYSVGSVEEFAGKTIYYNADVKLNGVPGVRIILGYADSNGQNRIGITEHFLTSNGKFQLYMNVDAKTYEGKVVAIWLYSHGSNEVGSVVGTSVEYSNLMVSVGNYEYQPYMEPVTTNIYLDEPLRKIGDYADYIDFENQKVVRKIATKIFDGTENIQVLSASPYPYVFWNIGEVGSVIDDMCLCTHLELQTNFSYTREGNNKFRVLNSTANNAARVVFRFYKDNAIISAVSSVKTLLGQYYNAGNPMIVYYAHADGLETEQTINLPQLKTYEDYTKIEVLTEVAPSKIEATYDGYTME